jgi:serine/threonine-protein kinase HipA
VSTDLEELWRRIIVYICVCNTDDHLRNHGFILTLKGWRLSPAFDINPVETGNGLKLNISLNDNALDIDLALSVIDYFRISKKTASTIIEQVKMSVRNWRQIAGKYNISKSEQDLKSMAFSRAER